MTDIRAEVEVAWLGLLDALRRAGYAADEMVRPGATEPVIAAAEAEIGRPLPAELRALYAISDGQVDWVTLIRLDGAPRGHGTWIGSVFGGGWTFASLAQLVQGWIGWRDVRDSYSPEDLAGNFDQAVEVRGDDPVLRVYTHADWIPFAIDGGGNALAADLAPTEGGTAGQVIVIGSDEDYRRVVAPGVVALLNQCRDLLLAGSDAVSEEPDEGVRLYDLEP